MLKFDRWKTVWSIAILSFFGGAVVLVFTGDETGSATAAEHSETAQAGDGAPKEADSKTSEAEVKSADGGTKSLESKHFEEASGTVEKIVPNANGCLADSATLQDLRRNREELDLRRKELASKENELKAREQVLNEEMKKLSVAREEIAKIGESRKKENDEKISKLVETVESMNPKSASALLGTIDETLAVATMARLSTPKLAKMMNVMDPARSSKLSELLAGVVRAKRSRPVSDDAAATTSERTLDPGKRGDKNDGKNSEQASNRTVNEGDLGATRREPASGSRKR